MKPDFYISDSNFFDSMLEIPRLKCSRFDLEITSYKIPTFEIHRF
jgi:hypothetical protein